MQIRSHFFFFAAGADDLPPDFVVLGEHRVRHDARCIGLLFHRCEKRTRLGARLPLVRFFEHVFGGSERTVRAAGKPRIHVQHSDFRLRLPGEGDRLPGRPFATASSRRSGRGCS
jgi:hypothetical protein